jgi:signal transduction histidine kinase
VSLRRRILLITILSVFALVAAVTGIAQVRANGVVAREQEARERADAVLNAIVQKIDAKNFPDPWVNQTNDPIFTELREYMASLLRPVSDGSAGICEDTGALLLVETVLPAGVARPQFAKKRPVDNEQRPPAKLTGMLPLDQDVVVEACRASSKELVTQVRHVAPNDLLFVSRKRVSSKTSAFVLVRIPNPARDPEGRNWHASLGVLAGATLFLVLLTLDTLRVLRQGSQSLERALGDLQLDLHAEISTPRAEELARIAQRMKEMATNLAASLDRERDLARRLGQEQRLVSLGRVIAGVAHEVRNPLTAMKLKLETMARRQLDARSSRDVTTCLEEIDRLDRVVRSLLLVARRGPSEKKVIQLENLADERIAAQAAVLEKQDVRVLRRGAACLAANREDLGRVIDNLLRNAIEASPRGRDVMVQIEAVSDEVRLEFVDWGDGVPENRVGELFEPFFTCKPDGTGLGLVLSRAIVEAHEGRLTYERTDGQTRFIATFCCSSPHGVPDVREIS